MNDATKKTDTPEGPLRLTLLTRKLDQDGASWYTIQLARALVAKGHKVQIICGGGSQLRRLANDNIECVVSRSLAHKWTSPLALFTVLRATYRFAPDIIHAQTQHLMTFAFILSHIIRRPYFLTTHHFIPENKRLRISPTWCKGIITISDAIREHLVNKVRAPKSLISVCYNGVDFKQYKSGPPIKKENRAFMIGSVGKLVPRKGHKFLLRAASILINEGLDLEVVIAGTGPERWALKAESVSLGIDKRVTILSYDIIPTEIIAAMDVFVLPSIQEGFGYSLLEAMACNKPIVASSVGGTYIAVREEENGFLVPAGEPQPLADRIRQLVENPELREKMGQRGREIVEQEFSSDKMASCTLAVYRRALAPE